VVNVVSLTKVPTIGMEEEREREEKGRGCRKRRR
jgi:hypothetical protein